MKHPVYKMTMTSFAITLYVQCSRLHVVGQRVVNDISVVRVSISVVEVSVTCVLNVIILICYCACSLLYLERLFCFI